jgi:hypothetical protein
MGPVEQAFRAQLRAPSTLRTIGRGAPFVLRAIRNSGIVFELGAKRTPTSVSWTCLESIPGYLRANPGWVKSGGVHSADVEPRTLDAHLKGFYRRDIANWIVVLLRDAGIVDVDPGPPLRLRTRR